MDSGPAAMGGKKKENQARRYAKKGEGKHLILLLKCLPHFDCLIRLGPCVCYRIISKVRGVLQTNQSPRLRRRRGSLDRRRDDPSSGPRMRVGEENERRRGGGRGWGGLRKIMASAARREVGEEGEIELLTWGMRYAQREKEFTLLLAR